MRIADRITAEMRRSVGGLPPPFWAVWTGTLVNRTGTFVEPFLVLYLTSHLHVGAATAGAVLAVAGAGSIIAQPPGGVLADRIGRRYALAAGMVGTAATELMLGYSSGLTQIFASAALFGCFVDLYRPSVQALVADIVPPTERPRAYGLLFWAINLGFSGAMVLGGLLAQGGFIWLFWADALTCVVFAFLVVRAIPETRPARAPELAPGRLADALRDKVFLVLVLINLGYASLYAQGTVGLPLSMRRSGLSPLAFGMTIALNGIVIILVQPFVSARLASRDHSRVMAFGQLLVGIGFGLGAFATTLGGYMFTVVVWTLGEIAVASVMGAIIAGMSPAHIRGRYAGVAGLAWGGGAVLGPLIGSAVLQAAGASALWFGCAALGAVLCAAQLGLGNSIRARRTDTGALAGPE